MCVTVYVITKPEHRPIWGVASHLIVHGASYPSDLRGSSLGKAFKKGPVSRGTVSLLSDVDAGLY